MELTSDDIFIIEDKIKNINNVLTIMDILNKPLEQLMNEKHYTQNEAINAKTAADRYLHKYGAFTIRMAINGITDVLKEH